MRKDSSNCKGSWPKVAVRKLLKIKSHADEFHSNLGFCGKVDKVERRRKSCSDQGSYAVVPEEFAGCLIEERNGVDRPINKKHEPELASNHDLSMFVGTWNVGGKSPQQGLTLTDWLTTPTAADIYVFGFQEIVPLNAGNVLGAEDNGPAAKWLSLIHRGLNDNDDDQESKDVGKQRFSFSESLSLDAEPDPLDFQRYSNFKCNTFPISRHHDIGRTTKNRYQLVASKQMVGLFLCVWVRSDLHPNISSLKVSCVGRGIMGYLGNKGSISISMIMHQTSFCFVCTHLASGEKDGDEIKRNSDVIEILRKTRFCDARRLPGQSHGILNHDKIIWLGDLNYRLAAPNAGDAIELLQRNDWQALLEKDQLKIEQRAGRVFKDWEEGKIYFAPTYKYLKDSDDYVVQTSTSKEKRRTPAWCDRILWKGHGLKQMWYVRGESKFSDHRPVSSLFSAQLNSARANNFASFSSKTNDSAASKSQTQDLLILARAAKSMHAEQSPVLTSREFTTNQ